MGVTPRLCWERLAFDSAHLGRPAARLRVVAGDDREALATELARRVDDWRRAGLWLVSCRVPADWTATSALLTDAGFRRVETLITFDRPIPSASSMPDRVMLATPGDAEACIAIGRSAFASDRYHADPRIDDREADTLKGAWVANACAGRADAVLVARGSGTVDGFVLCMLTRAAVVIDLIAVAIHARGRGLGKALIAGALAHYAGRAATLRAGTQEDNPASIALYRGAGFAETARAATFHWINEKAAA